MAKYLWEVSYSPEGMKGLMKEGGTSRVNMIEKLVQGMGGTLHDFYFAFGDNDAYLIADLPDKTDVTAIAMTVGASGAASVKTVVLLTPEEVDQATQRAVDYRPPGA